MRIIATSVLKAFYQQPTGRAAEQPLKVWIAVANASASRNPVEVKSSFNSADILPNGRVIFDLGGNKFRLITKINFSAGIVFIRFIGNHAQYDKVDATSI
jgi:mRNA interferase HigB